MLLAAILACLAAADETVVSSRRPADVDDVRLEGEAAVDPADALLSVPGVSLVREGGPLAVSRPMVRGLSGSRLDVSVLGLPFSDPAAGAVDAALPRTRATARTSISSPAGVEVPCALT